LHIAYPSWSVDSFAALLGNQTNGNGHCVGESSQREELERLMVPHGEGYGRNSNANRFASFMPLRTGDRRAFIHMELKIIALSKGICSYRNGTRIKRKRVFAQIEEGSCPAVECFPRL
jgi:hypothetical protein